MSTINCKESTRSCIAIARQCQMSRVNQELKKQAQEEEIYAQRQTISADDSNAQEVNDNEDEDEEDSDGDYDVGSLKHLHSWALDNAVDVNDLEVM